MKKIRVFFNLSEKARARQKDVAKYPPKDIEALTPKIKIRKEGVNKINKEKGIKKIIKDLAIKFNPILYKKKKIKVDAEFIYNYSGFLDTKIPYTTEVDNPLSLTYYGLLAINNPIVKKAIEQEYKKENFIKFIAMSKASAKGMEYYFGEEINDKLEVLYPPFPFNIKRKEREDDTVEFIFVSYMFREKGGREIIRAAKKLNGRFKVTFITEYKGKNNKNIEFKNKMPRKELLKLMTKKDVVLVPTYWDSFNIAAYEAINIGLAGIGTNMYAIPEYIKNEKNGFLTKSPVQYWNDYLPNPKFWLYGSVSNYVKNKDFPEVEKFLADKMQYYIDNLKELKKHQKYSRKLHEEKFKLKIRNKKLYEIIKEAVL